MRAIFLLAICILAMGFTATSFEEQPRKQRKPMSKLDYQGFCHKYDLKSIGQRVESHRRGYCKS